MADPVPILTPAALRKVRGAVGYVADTPRRQDAGRRGAPAAPGTRTQVVTVTGPVNADGVYPGNWLDLIAGTLQLQQGGPCWVYPLPGQVLKTGGYYHGRLWADHTTGTSTLPVFTVDHCCGDATTGGCCQDATPYAWTVAAVNLQTGQLQAANGYFGSVASALVPTPGNPCTWVDSVGSPQYTLTIANGLITLTVLSGGPGEQTSLSVYQAPFNGQCCQQQALTLVEGYPGRVPQTVVVASDCACPPWVPGGAPCFSYANPTLVPLTVTVPLSGFASFAALTALGTVKAIYSMNAPYGGTWGYFNVVPPPGSAPAVSLSISVGTNWALTLTYTVGGVISTATYTSSGGGADCCSAVTLSRSATTGSMNSGNTPASIVITPNCCGQTSSGSQAGSGGSGNCGNATVGAGKAGNGASVGSLTIPGVALSPGEALVVYVGTVVAAGAGATPVASVKWNGVALDQYGHQIYISDGTNLLSLSQWLLVGSLATAATGSIVATLAPGNGAAMLMNAVIDTGGNGNPDQGGAGYDNGGASQPSAQALGPTTAACEAANAGFLFSGGGTPVYGGGFVNGGQDVSLTFGGITYTLSEGYALLVATGTPDATITNLTPPVWVGLMATME